MSRPPDPAPDLRATLDAAAGLALDLHRQLAELHARLATTTEPGGEAEALLARLLRERDDAIVLLGRAALRWVAAGGTLAAGPRALDPEEATSPEPEAAQPDDEPAVEPVDAPTVVPPPPAPAPPRPVARPAPPASEAALQALQKHGLGPAWGARPSAAAQRRSLARILDGLGEPRLPHDEDEADDDLGRLSAAAGRVDGWLDHPKPVQRRLMGLLVCRARALQGWMLGQPGPGVDTSALNSLFSSLSSWSREHEPGFVNGLARDAKPRAESWLAEARSWWDALQQDVGDRSELPSEEDEALTELRRVLEAAPDAATLTRAVQAVLAAGVAASDPRLVDLMVPHESALNGSGLKTLRKRVRERNREEDAAEEAADHAEPLPPDWPYLPQTRGKRAAIVGGDPREASRKRIQKAFGFAELDWGETNQRRISSIAERISSGKLDMVLFLARFSGHSMVDHLMPACRAAGATFVNVEHGYGVNQVRRSLERFLAAP